MQLPRRAAIVVGLFFGLAAGCRGKSNPSDGGRGGPFVDSGTDQDAQAPTCGETINQYCQSDGSTCLAGVARDWTTAQQQASSRCAVSHNVFFQQCLGYGVLNAAGVDDDTVYFYDLATSLLVRVDHIQFGGSTSCIAGVNLAPVDCSADAAAPTYVCTDAGAASGAGTDAGADAGRDAGADAGAD